MQEKMLSHVRDRASSRKWNLPSKAEGFFSFCRNIIPPQPPPVDTYIQQAEANLLHSSTICWVGRVRLLIWEAGVGSSHHLPIRVSILGFSLIMIRFLSPLFSGKSTQRYSIHTFRPPEGNGLTFVWTEKWHPLCAQIPLFAPWKDEWNTTTDDWLTLGRGGRKEGRKKDARNLGNVPRNVQWLVEQFGFSQTHLPAARQTM